VRGPSRLDLLLHPSLPLSLFLFPSLSLFFSIASPQYAIKPTIPPTKTYTAVAQVRTTRNAEIISKANAADSSGAGTVDNKRPSRFSNTNNSNDEGAQAGALDNIAFIENMRSEVFAQSVSGGIEERLSKNKHYVQKGVDQDSEGFTRRD
jgi:hypothetical protein